jgi:hypothetical protein
MIVFGWTLVTMPAFSVIVGIRARRQIVGCSIS